MLELMENAPRGKESDWCRHEFCGRRRYDNYHVG